MTNHELTEQIVTRWNKSNCSTPIAFMIADALDDKDAALAAELAQLRAELAAANKRAEALREAFEKLLAYLLSDDDATWTENGYFLTPLQIAERIARAALDAAKEG